jgi:hypothetical protein
MNGLIGIVCLKINDIWLHKFNTMRNNRKPMGHNLYHMYKISHVVVD